MTTILGWQKKIYLSKGKKIHSGEPSKGCPEKAFERSKINLKS